MKNLVIRQDQRSDTKNLPFFLLHSVDDPYFNPCLVVLGPLYYSNNPFSGNPFSAYFSLGRFFKKIQNISLSAVFLQHFYNFQFDTVRPRLVRFHLVRQISGTKVRTKRVLTVVQSTVVEEQQSFDSRGESICSHFPSVVNLCLLRGPRG